MSSHGTATSAGSKRSGVYKTVCTVRTHESTNLVEVGIGHHVVMANHFKAALTPCNQRGSRCEFSRLFRVKIGYDMTYLTGGPTRCLRAQRGRIPCALLFVCVPYIDVPHTLLPPLARTLFRLVAWEDYLLLFKCLWVSVSVIARVAPDCLIVRGDHGASLS